MGKVWSLDFLGIRIRTTYYYVLLRTTTYYYVLLRTTYTYYVLLRTTTYHYVLLRATTYYYVLLRTTYTYYYVLRIRTTTYYVYVLRTTTYYYVLRTTYYYVLRIRTTYYVLRTTTYYIRTTCYVLLRRKTPPTHPQGGAGTLCVHVVSLFAYTIKMIYLPCVHMYIHTYKQTINQYKQKVLIHKSIQTYSYTYTWLQMVRPPQPTHRGGAGTLCVHVVSLCADTKTMTCRPCLDTHILTYQQTIHGCRW